MTRYKNKNKINSVQETIVQFITDTPGIRYRELLRGTGLSNGVLSYHLNILNISGRIQIHRVNNRVTRYFSHDVSRVEYTIIGLIRQPTARNIILYMLEYEYCEFNDIMNHIKKVPSTVSWHLSRLRDAKIIDLYIQNEHFCYGIKINKLVLKKLLNKYKSSFTENIVDNYENMIDVF
ncbi:MAG TPA: ArsR family transcriptional regulator [Nitrososphaeraceae archaeon]|nr:ArsR family transcriptional regulator [Nitrososphaeraceae archaeon]